MKRPAPLTTARQVRAFVRRHGIVLASARGPVPRLTEAIAGAPIRGSWWAHPEGRRIFQLLSAVTDADDVLVCRLVGGKVTLVDDRLWPALVRLAPMIGADRLAWLHEEHTASGRHETRATPFPDWVSAAVRARAQQLDAAAARALLPLAVRALAGETRKLSPGGDR